MSSREKVLAAADAMCERANKNLIVSPPKGATSAVIAGEISANAKVEKRAVEELRGLRVPAGMARLLGTVTKYRNELANDLNSLARAMRRGDHAAVSSIGFTKEKTHSLLLISASRAGFKHCGLT